ncbi:MAG: nuclease, partial [Chloroflexota bacterium]
RPALAQTFEDNDSGGVFTAVVNHLKSKGSPCGPGDDDPQQGSCNLTRTLSAQILADWLASDPTNSGDPDFLIIGDLNAYDKEDPIDALVDAGYTDLLHQYQGEFAYSFVFDGQLGYLDHGLANSALLPQVTGATAWHINADEPDIIDYDTSFKQPAQAALYEPNAYRSSDHDPVIIGLNVGAPYCGDAAPSVASLWPPNHKFHSIDVQGVVDPEGDDFTINIDSIFQDEAVDAPDSGNTAPDGRGVGTPTAEVRAERVGTGGNGRVYHIFFTATDSTGRSCSGEVLVSVPVSRNATAVDDGALFDSTVDPADLP